MEENKGKNMDFTGTWHIYEMEEWDEDYFNVDVQAYIEIEPDNDGDFQFGLVRGDIDGRIVDYADGKRFEFTFEGNEEGDYVSGFGWVRIKEKNVLEGEFRFHRGDSSTFSARTVEQQIKVLRGNFIFISYYLGARRVTNAQTFKSGMK
jgi:hypothetical protein